MSDDYPPSTPQKSWLEKISHLLTGEPQDVDDLLNFCAKQKREVCWIPMHCQ